MSKDFVHKIIDLIKQGVINNLIWFLGMFVKKDYNFWIFGMEEGTRFTGNILYFYSYIRKNHPDIRTVCFINPEGLQKEIRNKGGNVCRVNSWKSFISALKAGVCVFSHEMAHDLVNFSTNGVCKINLWHGMPLKKIQYSSEKIKYLLENKSPKERMKDILCGYIKHEEYDFLPCTSEAYARIMSDAFNNKNVYMTGNPRDEIFFQGINRNDILEKYNLEEVIHKKIITYLPTFRDTRKTDETYSIFEKSPAIREKIGMNNWVVLQKNHQSRLKERINYGTIYNLTDDIEPQELLFITDVLITDYSSCYIDFLLTLRPIIFYPYDLEEYITNDRELYFDYNDVIITPGIKVRGEEDLFYAIEMYLENPARDLEKRQKSLSFFHTYSDGNASERVCGVITDIIGKKLSSIR